jgi:transposase InsO family protein
MSSDSVTFRGSTTIPKLTETNWNQWEQPMTTWLEFNGLYPYATGEETEPTRPVKTETQSDESIAAAIEKYNLRMTIWRQKNAQTRAALKTCIREDLQYVITPDMSAKQAWDAVVSAYKKQTVTGNTAIVTAIMNKTYKDGEDLSAHIGWMRQQNNFLLNTKLHIPDEILAARLLASLPPNPSWQPLAMTISTWDESKFTFSQVASTLQSEAQRRAATLGSAANPISLATSNLSQQKKPTCSYCNRSGGSHTAETCFVLHPELKEKLNKQKQKQQQASGKKTAQPANTQPDSINVTIGNLDSSDDDGQDYSEPHPTACCKTVDDGGKAIHMDTTLSVQDTAASKYQSPRTGGHFTITMDGGSTCHVWKEHPTTMLNYREVTGRNVQVGDGRIVPIKGVGSIRFSTGIGKVVATITIHNVCHAPGMTYNLISEPLLDAAGYRVNKGDGLCVVRPKHGKPILIAPKTSSQLYQTTAVVLSTTHEVLPPHRSTSSPPRTATTLSTVATNGKSPKFNSAEHWHAALGHPGPSRVLKLFKHGLVTGVDCEAITRAIEQSGPPRRAECDSCMIGKSHRQPFTGQAERAQYPLQIIHTDVGSVSDTGLNGHYYYLTITDDFTRWVYVVTTSRKDGDTIGPLIRDWINWAERQHSEKGYKVNTIRSDGGGEYMNSELQTWCTERGITQDITNPHTPQMNGVAERLNRTLMDVVRTVLYQSGLPARFWTEAIRYAAYLHNRLPHRSLNGHTTPYQEMYGKRPTAKYLRPFGIVGFLHLPEHTGRKKLQDRSNLCVLVGFATQTKGWRVWCPYNWHSHVTESRDVDWREWQYYKEQKREQQESGLLDAGRGGANIDSLSIFSSSSNQQELPTFDGTDSDTNDEADSTHAQHEEKKDDSDTESDEDGPAHNQPVDASPPAVEHMSGELRRLRDARGSGPLDNAPSPLNSQEFTTRTRSGRVISNISQALAAAHSTGPDEEPPEPRTYKEALKRSDWQRWKRSMRTEYDQLIRANTWDLVPYERGMNVVGCRWVYKLKTLANGGTKEKSRLVAQGFTQVPGVDYEETYSPVVRYASLRALFALAAHHDWEVHHMDVRSAYLNGKLEETIYMEQPAGFVQEGQRRLICKLKKGLYGLKQAGRTWHQTIDPALRRFGLQPLGSDYCVYINQSEGETIIICLYVDDLFLFTSSRSKLQRFKQCLMDAFEMEDLGEARLVLGMEIQRDRRNRKITISQATYLRKALIKLGVADLNSVTTPMDANTHLTKAAVGHEATPAEITHYQSIIGTLQYAANGTRPDIAYAVNQCARYSSNPDHTHFAVAKRILRYIKGSVDQALTYTGTNQKQPLLIGYSDADYANDKDDRLSVSGYTFLLCGGAVSWASRRQKTLATSTVEAEYMAIAEAAKEAVWWRSLLGELGYDMGQPTPLFNDNQGSIHLAKNADHHARTKHIDVKYHYIRQELIKRTITLNHVSTRDNVADLFTKALVRDKHAAFTRTLGVFTPASSWGSVGSEASAAGMNAEQDARANHVHLC